MATYKIVNSDQLNSDLTSVANIIKSMCGLSTTSTLKFPNRFTTRLNNIRSAMQTLLSRSITQLSSDLLGNTTTIGEYAFAYCQSLKKVTIPTNITEINGSAFFKCAGLTHVYIYATSLTIASTAFRECTAITDVYVYSRTPFTIGSSTFTSSSCTIHVPAGTEATYKSTTNWAGCADRIVGDL
jgi:hypothetical protein